MSQQQPLSGAGWLPLALLQISWVFTDPNALGGHLRAPQSYLAEHGHKAPGAWPQLAGHTHHTLLCTQQVVTITKGAIRDAPSSIAVLV